MGECKEEVEQHLQRVRRLRQLREPRLGRLLLGRGADLRPVLCGGGDGRVRGRGLWRRARSPARRGWGKGACEGGRDDQKV